MRVAVVGLGVMGGSLARALAASAGEHEAACWADDPVDRAAAADAGLRVSDGLDASIAGADLVVLATPLGAVPTLAARLAESVGEHTVVTDVASLQAPALEAARMAGLTGAWVTSHPLAGSERSGFEASRVDLYDATPVYLSAGPESALHTRATVATLWESVGAVPEWIDAAEHDERMSLVSHLPQMVSTALADAMAAAGVSADSLGPGGRDVTRLAASSTSMWRDLFAHANPALARALRDVATRLSEDAAALELGDPDSPAARLERAGGWRKRT